MWAGLAAGGMLSVLYGTAIAPAEETLRLAPTDFASTVSLFVIFGGGWLVAIFFKDRMN